MYSLSKFPAADFDPGYWGWTETGFVDPKNWNFTWDNDEEAFAFCLINYDDYDQSLPFTFGGDSDEIWEASVQVSKGNEKKFSDFLVSVGFNKVQQWW